MIRLHNSYQQDTQSTQSLQQLTCADISQASARSPCERGGAFAWAECRHCDFTPTIIVSWLWIENHLSTNLDETLWSLCLGIKKRRKRLNALHYHFHIFPQSAPDSPTIIHMVAPQNHHLNSDKQPAWPGCRGHHKPRPNRSARSLRSTLCLRLTGGDEVPRHLEGFKYGWKWRGTLWNPVGLSCFIIVFPIKNNKFGDFWGMAYFQTRLPGRLPVVFLLPVRSRESPTHCTLCKNARAAEACDACLQAAKAASQLTSSGKWNAVIISFVRLTACSQWPELLKDARTALNVFRSANSMVCFLGFGHEMSSWLLLH